MTKNNFLTTIFQKTTFQLPSDRHITGAALNEGRVAKTRPQRVSTFPFQHITCVSEHLRKKHLRKKPAGRGNKIEENWLTKIPAGRPQIQGPKPSNSDSAPRAVNFAPKISPGGRF